MKRFIVIAVMLCFFTTGCTGSFALTKKVYNWHRSNPDKWGDEIGFLICTLLPIYGISTFADAIVFNSIEFWTGENPVMETVQVKDGKDEALLAFNPQDQQLRIASSTGQGDSTIIFERVDNMVYAKDGDGQVLYITALRPDGQFMVYDSNLELVKSFSPAEVEDLKAKYLR